MRSFRLEIKVGNEAMQTGYNVAVALREVAVAVKSGETHGNIRDGNGNTVGDYRITRREEN